MSKASPSVENFGDDDPDAFPRPFGSYLLLQRFARGGMGEVFLGKFGAIAGLERYCVLKKLRSELTRDREYVTRFIDEARVVVTLNHANICHVFDVGRVGDEYYLAMEYVSGRDIRTVQDRCRQRERTIPAATTLHLVCEVLEALDYAHRRNHPITGEPLNLVHRDVSPQNVLVSYEGEVKLIDFGLAASKLKVERTQPNVVMGKMAYMAPEQARGDPIDSRADLFACGVLAYELLAGERFYEGMSANDIWQVAGRGSFVPPKWQALDPEVAKILAKSLHPDPKKRFATCGDFREALASHLHWRFPGTGVRGVRDVINELFADEIKKERETMSRFGRVTVASFRTTFENTQSQSVSLARAADDEASQPNSTHLTRDEQSSSAPGGPMPPPGSRDVHHEPTRLTTDPKKLLPREDTATSAPSDPSTAEQSEASRLSSALRPSPTTLDVAAVDGTSRQAGDTERTARPTRRQQTEPTQLVRRQSGGDPPSSRPVVKSFDLEAGTLSTRPRRSPVVALAGLGALLAVGAFAFVLLAPGANKEVSTSSFPEAAAPAPPIPATSLTPTPAVEVAAEPAAVVEPPAPLEVAPPPVVAAVIPEVAAPPLPAVVDTPKEPVKVNAERDKQRQREATQAMQRRAAEKAERAQAERVRLEEQRADEARRKAHDEAERRKAEPPAPRTPEEIAMQCGRCENELSGWRRNKGNNAFLTALEICVKKCR